MGRDRRIPQAYQPGDQAIEYFFDRIRGQILTALAKREMCEDLYLLEILAVFERDRLDFIKN